jgi:hypothetical protein
MANFCGRCGTPVVAEQKFCPTCGSPLTAGVAPTESAVKRPAAAGNRTAIAMAIVVLVLIAGGIATFVVMHRSPSPQHATPTHAAPTPVDLSTLPGSKFEVTYQPETVVIDPATTQKSFEGVSADGAVFVFNTSVPAIRGLKAGSVLLLQGLALKKVVAVETAGDSLIVATVPATLTDAIQDGHIQFDAPITFDDSGSSASLGAPPASVVPGWKNFSAGIALAPAWAFAPPPMPVALVAAPSPKEGAEGDWKFTSKATKEAGQLNLDVDVKGALEGMTVDLTAKGHVQSFGLITDIQISHGVIEQFKYVAKNLRGDVDVDFVAKKSGDGMIKGLEIKLPTPFQAPLPIGGIPFVLSIGEALILKPALSAKNEIAQGHFNLKYGGGQGFSMSGPGMAGEGQPGGEGQITNSSSLAIAPFAYIIAFAMPRVELTLGLEKATGFETLAKAIPSGIADRAAELLSKTTIGSQIAGAIKKTIKSEAAAYVEMVMVVSHLDSGPLVLLPCKKTTLEVHSKVGYDVSALGKTTEGSKEVEMGSKQVIQQTPENIRCGE